MPVQYNYAKIIQKNPDFRLSFRMFMCDSFKHVYTPLGCLGAYGNGYVSMLIWVVIV